MTPEDFDEDVAYRIAHGLARREAERQRVGPNDPGRDQGVMLRRLVEETTREAGDGARLGAIREGVEDALAGRRPRWPSLSNRTKTNTEAGLSRNGSISGGRPNSRETSRHLAAERATLYISPVG